MFSDAGGAANLWIMEDGHHSHPASDNFGGVMQRVGHAHTLCQRYRTVWWLGDLEEIISIYREVVRDLALTVREHLHTAEGCSLSLAAAETLPKNVQVERKGQEPQRTCQGSFPEPTNWNPSGAEDLLSICRIELVASLADYHDHLGRSEILDEQERLCRDGLRDLASSHPRSATYLHWLGVTLRKRYEDTSALSLIEEAVALQRQARRQHVGGLVALAPILSELGFSLARRFQHLGSRADLTEAIALHRQALQMAHDTDPYLYLRLFNLSHGLFVSYLTAGDVVELQESGAILRQVLHMCPPGHKGRPRALDGLAMVLWLMYEQTGNLNDLEEAIGYGSEALRLADKGDPHLPKYLTNHATTLQRRFSRLGNIADLEKAIETYRYVLNVVSKTYRFRDHLNSNLSASLHDLYLLRGDLSILEEAIRLQRAGVAGCKPGDPQKSWPINNLAKLVLARYRQTMDSDDLAEAIDLWREALSLRPPGRPHHGEAVCQLAEGLVMSFQRSGQESHLNEAIDLHLGWSVNGNPNDHRQSHFLYISANAFHIRFEHFRNGSDLEDAIERYRSSLVLRPVGHSERHLTMHALASALRTRYHAFNDPEDIEGATLMQEDALELLPPAHPDRALLLCGLARMHLTEGSMAFSVSAAMNVISDALAEDHSSAQVRIGEASDILQALDERIAQYPARFNPSHRRLLDIHILAIGLLPSIANFGLDIRARLRLLVKAEQIAVRAARIALTLDEPTKAMEILEEGRAVFWAQFLRLRTTFVDLPEGTSEQLTILANQLQASSDNRTSTSDSGPKERLLLEEQAAQRRSLSEKFEALVLHVRAMPGFERFLLPASYSALIQAAQGGIIVTIIPGKTETHAVIMRNSDHSSSIEVLKLPVSSARLVALSTLLQDANSHQRKRLRNAAGTRAVVARAPVRFMGSRQVISELWDAVAQPIMMKLGLPRSSGRRRPRLWWCTTGVSAFLPIHAAGTFLDDAICCSDYVVSSYTPTIGALISSRKKNFVIDLAAAKLLLVGVPRPFEGEVLEDVVNETITVKSTVPSRNVIPLPLDADCSINPDASAAVEDVVSRLPDASFLHLACHGTQDRENALDSGFAMRDRMMTVAQLMSLRLPHAFLAFLSACETAKGDEKQPDQAVHLAAAMLFVGFRSVVGTMWSMGDVDGPLVAQTVYQQLFGEVSDELDPECVPYALDDATQQLRARGLHPSRWAPYIHLGV